MHGPSYVISTAAFVNLGPARILSAMEESCYMPIDCERVHTRLWHPSFRGSTPPLPTF